MKQLFDDEESEKAFGDLQYKLKKEYKNLTPGEHLDSLLIEPIEGMPVAAPFDEHGQRSW